MIRWLKRLCVLGMVVFAVTFVAVVFQANHMRDTHGGGQSVVGPYDAAIILGAGIEPDGLIPYTGRRRVAIGVDLLKAGKVGRLIISDGSRKQGTRRGAEDMADYAVSLGAPREALLLERESRSTLQNLLFSRVIAREHDLKTLVLVTDSVHLTRAELLAGYLDIQLAGLAAADVRREQGVFSTWPYLTREALAWWYNLGKAAAWSGLGWLGWTPEERSKYVK